MFELIYIEAVLPLVGEALKAEEMVPVVEPSGMVTARSSRSNVHKNHLLHPVVRLNLVNRKGEIFLQKRSKTKDTYPGYWDTAASGHVSYGETISETLRRESLEELGFSEYNPMYIDKYVYDGQSETELVTVFVAIGNFDLHPCNDEVDEGAWWPADKVDSNLGKGVFTPGFEYDWKHYRDKMFALL